MGQVNLRRLQVPTFAGQVRVELARAMRVVLGVG